MDFDACKKMVHLAVDDKKKRNGKIRDKLTQSDYINDI
jgi:hypothetical protein